MFKHNLLSNCVWTFDGVTSNVQTQLDNKLETSDTLTDFLSGLIESPENRDYILIQNVPFAGTITETTTKSSAGTCTATFYIGATALGGDANAVSTTEDINSHSTSNSFSVGDDIKVNISSNSSCANMAFTIKYTRALS